MLIQHATKLKKDWQPTDHAIILRQKGAKTPPHPLLSLLSLGVEGHLGARFVADRNTIILTEAIFEFPIYTRDICKKKGPLLTHFRDLQNAHE